MLDARLGSAETLMVYGRDWDPSVAFYGQRKAIIDPFNWSPTDERMQTLVGNLKPSERIGAMIVGGDLRKDAAFIQERILAYGLEETPQASYYGDVYFRKAEPASDK